VSLTQLQSAERLRLGATILRTRIKDDVFNMDYWWNKRYDGDGPCGTIGCAMGHFCNQGEFIAMGLRSNDKGMPVYENELGIGAAAALFGIHRDFAAYLFLGGMYSDRPTRLDVAERMERHAAILSSVLD
jgi:hypothetical protein